jgi:hypothetical protein
MNAMMVVKTAIIKKKYPTAETITAATPSNYTPHRGSNRAAV